MTTDLGIRIPRVPRRTPAPTRFEMSRFAIDDGGPDDLPAARALLKRCGLPLDGLADHTDQLLVARWNGRLVGTAALEVYADGVLLRSVAADEQHRGTGLGTQLTQAALDRARRLGASHVYLLTTTAAPFFARRGFETIARRDVPASVRQSVEFTSACPASATVMARAL